MRKSFFVFLSWFLSFILAFFLIYTIFTSDIFYLWVKDFAEKNIKHFEDWIKTTDDGYVYYFNENSEKGVYILKIPDTKEVTIPEYIDGNRVVEVGHLREEVAYLKRYVIVGENTKKLTVQHGFDIQYEHARNYVNFPNLTHLIFIDFLYCNQSYSETELIVPHYIGEKTANIPKVELRKSNHEYSLENFGAEVIIIPEYVTVIEAGVFSGLEGVTIKTSYKSKPEGWEDGWNGNCRVEWSAELNNKNKMGGNYGNKG